MAKKCARTFSITVEKGKKSILEVSHLLPDALPRSVWCARGTMHIVMRSKLGTPSCMVVAGDRDIACTTGLPPGSPRCGKTHSLC